VRALAAAAAASANATRVVLVVEDEAISRHALVALFKASGWTPVQAATLPEALAALDAQEVHAVVLDLMLPGGNGADVLRLLRSRGATTSVAVVTGAFDWQLLDEVRRLAPDRIFRKPVDFADIKSWLATL
jgi:DNA-binding response OmpR family regulator